MLPSFIVCSPTLKSKSAGGFLPSSSLAWCGNVPKSKMSLQVPEGRFANWASSHFSPLAYRNRRNQFLTLPHRLGCDHCMIIVYLYCLHLFASNRLVLCYCGTPMGGAFCRGFVLKTAHSTADWFLNRPGISELRQVDDAAAALVTFLERNPFHTLYAVLERSSYLERVLPK